MNRKSQSDLPVVLDRYRRYGSYSLVVAVGLALFSLLTNPVPDPSFPWFSLPASLRLPFTQPRIEHWPVSYTLGVWLWVFSFPALFLQGYHRFGSGRFDRQLWLLALPTGAVFAWTTYCRLFWPKLDPATWNAPSYTPLCWLYCSTYDLLYNDAALAVGVFGVVALVVALRRARIAPYAMIGFGVLSSPLGFPAAYLGLEQLRA